MPSPTETITAYFAAIRRKDAGAWVDCFAAEGVARDPAHGPPRQGHAAHRAFFEGVVGLFAELAFHPGEPQVCGDRAAVAFTARCVTHSGTVANVQGIDLFHFDGEGRILSLDGYWDPTALLAAAGVG